MKHQVKEKMKKKLDLKVLHKLQLTSSSWWFRREQKFPSTAALKKPYLLTIFNKVNKKVKKGI
jgi:hypothetical protein